MRRCSAGMRCWARHRSPAQLLEGRHEVRIKAAGYKVWQDSITVVAGEPQTIADIRLEPADATLFLASSPARANATVNGNFLGLTPLEVPLTPGEATRIRLFKQGYKPAARSMTAKSGEQKRLSVTLEPELVPVVVRVEPGDAKIFVDGAPVGEGNRTCSYPPTNTRWRSASRVTWITKPR